MSYKIKQDPKSGVFFFHASIARKRIRQSLRTRDKETAEHLASEIERRELRKSLYGPEKETTFEELALGYMAEGGECRYVAPILKAFGRNRKVAELNGPYVRKAAKTLYPDVKPQTLNRYVIKPVNAILHWGSDAKLCALMSIRGFPSMPIKPREAAPQEWVASFVHACDEGGWHYVGTYALFLHVTAARPSEAMALSPQHLDLDKKIGLSEPTKTGTHRVFHLTDELVRRFRLYPPKRLQWGKGKGELRIFGYADAQGPDEIWDRVCEEAGLPRFTPYQAGRKSFASTLISQRREDAKTAMAIGNWKDIRIFMEHYVTPHDIEGFVSRNFEGLLARNWQVQTQTSVQTSLQPIEITEKKAANGA